MPVLNSQPGKCGTTAYGSDHLSLFPIIGTRTLILSGRCRFSFAWIAVDRRAASRKPFGCNQCRTSGSDTIRGVPACQAGCRNGFRNMDNACHASGCGINRLIRPSNFNWSFATVSSPPSGQTILFLTTPPVSVMQAMTFDLLPSVVSAREQSTAP